MKKSCLLLALVMILMTACSTPAQNSQTGSGDESCLHVNVYRTVSEYENYLTKFQLPSDFVHLDSIPNLGAFKYLYPYPDFPNKYYYAFRDSDGGDIHLTVTHNVETNAKTELGPELSITPDMTSMRKVPCTGYSVIKRNGMEYRYGEFGYLMHIVWYDDNTEFELYADWNTKSAPLISRLMSISETEAAAAFAEIKQSLDAGK